jgi:hypothetical protein
VVIANCSLARESGSIEILQIFEVGTQQGDIRAKLEIVPLCLYF